MKSFLFVIILLFINSSFIISQDVDSIYYTVDLSKTIHIPADEIIFTVNITTENSNPQSAHQEHKVVEGKLLKLLKEFNIGDTSVVYSLISINSKNGYNSQELSAFKTNQKVQFKLNKLDDYAEVQIKLLENGIYFFEANFSSSAFSKSRSLGVQLALEEAYKDAELFAKSLNKKVLKPVDVSSFLYERNLGNISFITAARPIPQSELIEIPQYIENTVKLKIKYLLVNL